MKYLGIDPIKPKIAVFDFTCCEGCELQLANKEDTLPGFLNALEIVTFREISSAASDEYDIAFIEGSVSRSDEIARLLDIREKAKVLVAMGSCACYGGVNRLKNAYDINQANREVYGNSPKETMPVRSVKEVVPVDLEIHGCPISKAEVERIIQHLVWDLPYQQPVYPVCLECKQRFTTCAFDLGQLCLGPITRGGCEAPCPAGGFSCWGCRGPADETNYEEFLNIIHEHGYSDKELNERLQFFGGFEEIS